MESINRPCVIAASLIVVFAAAGVSAGFGDDGTAMSPNGENGWPGSECILNDLAPDGGPGGDGYGRGNGGHGGHGWICGQSAGDGGEGGKSGPGLDAAVEGPGGIASHPGTPRSKPRRTKLIRIHHTNCISEVSTQAYKRLLAMVIALS